MTATIRLGLWERKTCVRIIFESGKTNRPWVIFILFRQKLCVYNIHFHATDVVWEFLWWRKKNYNNKNTMMVIYRRIARDLYVVNHFRTALIIAEFVLYTYIMREWLAMTGAKGNGRAGKVLCAYTILYIIGTPIQYMCAVCTYLYRL